ncbi:MAG: hypothetical protein H0W76_21020 [Pyrinomonadaceae bacterium]|nr:hypothetical protein [Pyrinomonadaceae bacterium]
MKCDLETTSALAALLTEFAPEPSEELAELRANFNADKGKVRLLLLLSPT